MIGNGIDPNLAARQADNQEMVRFKTQMDGLKKRLAGEGANKEAQLKKACQNFEAVFIGKLWQQMKSTVPKEGYLHSKQEDSYMAMFDREFSEKMAHAGGLGLADMIYAQLSEKLKQTSKNTLGGAVDIRPLNPEPMALNRGGTPMPLSKEKPNMTLEEWGGEADEEAGGVMSSEDIAAGLTGSVSDRRPMNDVDVKARLDEIARRLEGERIRDGLLGNSRNARSEGYGQDAESGKGEEVGRKFARIG